MGNSLEQEMKYLLMFILCVMWGCIIVLAGWPWWAALGGGIIGFLAWGD